MIDTATSLLSLGLALLSVYVCVDMRTKYGTVRTEAAILVVVVHDWRTATPCWHVSDCARSYPVLYVLVPLKRHVLTVFC